MFLTLGLASKLEHFAKAPFLKMSKYFIQINNVEMRLIAILNSVLANKIFVHELIQSIWSLGLFYVILGHALLYFYYLKAADLVLPRKTVLLFASIHWPPLLTGLTGI